MIEQSIKRQEREFSADGIYKKVGSGVLLCRERNAVFRAIRPLD